MFLLLNTESKEFINLLFSNSRVMLSSPRIRRAQNTSALGCFGPNYGAQDLASHRVARPRKPKTHTCRIKTSKWIQSARNWYSYDLSHTEIPFKYAPLSRQLLPSLCLSSSPTTPMGTDNIHTLDQIDLEKPPRKKTSKQKASTRPLENNEPYRQYVRHMINIGWNNLHGLDEYMSTASLQQPLALSVLDVFENLEHKIWPDMYNERDIGNFIRTQPRDGVKVRLYLAEYDKYPPSALMETLGSALDLDPRFFQWSINRKGHVFTPSQRHRAAYVNIGFGVLVPSGAPNTDAEEFKVLVYVKVMYCPQAGGRC